MDSVTLLFAWLGGIANGTFPVFIKTDAVLQAKVHPTVFQLAKSTWACIFGLALLIVRAAENEVPVYAFTPWAVISASMWIPAGVSTIVAVPLIGVGPAVLSMAATGSLLSFLVFWLVFGENMKTYDVHGLAVCLAPIYMFGLVCGMGGLVASHRWSLHRLKNSGGTKPTAQPVAPGGPGTSGEPEEPGKTVEQEETDGPPDLEPPAATGTSRGPSASSLSPRHVRGYARRRAPSDDTKPFAQLGEAAGAGEPGEEDGPPDLEPPEHEAAKGTNRAPSRPNLNPHAARRLRAYARSVRRRVKQRKNNDDTKPFAQSGETSEQCKPSDSEPLELEAATGTSRAQPTPNPPPPLAARQVVIGYTFAVLAGVFSASQFGLVTLGHHASGDVKGDPRFDPLGSWMATFGVSAVLITLAAYVGAALRERKCPPLHLRVIAVPGSAAGMFWTLANLLTTLAVLRGGNAVVMAQCNAARLVTSGLWGLLYYREIRGWPAVAWAASAFFTSSMTVLLSFEKRGDSPSGEASSGEASST